MYQNVANTYQQANLYTAHPVKLVIICYDGAISSLRAARASYAAKDYEAKAKALQRSYDIIHELIASLDIQKGGKIAVNLRTLYNYIIQTLLVADAKRDLNAFDRAILILEELQSAWKAIAQPEEGAMGGKVRQAGGHSNETKPAAVA